MLESRIYRMEEVILAAWFVQKGHRAGFEGSRSRLVVGVGRNEDDRDLPVGRNDLTLELESVHARHPDVENQACRFARVIRTQERFRRRETLRPKSDGSEQIIERIPQRVIIVNNRNERNAGHRASFSSRWSCCRKNALCSGAPSADARDP
jgi:hypothetical protein